MPKRSAHSTRCPFSTATSVTEPRSTSESIDDVFAAVVEQTSSTCDPKAASSKQWPIAAATGTASCTKACTSAAADAILSVPFGTRSSAVSGLMQQLTKNFFQSALCKSSAGTTSVLKPLCESSCASGVALGATKFSASPVCSQIPPTRRAPWYDNPCVALCSPSTACKVSAWPKPFWRLTAIPCGASNFFAKSPALRVCALFTSRSAQSKRCCSAASSPKKQCGLVTGRPEI
mmetsp:Transcript_101744/g.286914  ORF Transcript_101744/g.286914 Transcript_101744/m.286914 type:complete len:233 (+) Transcript_101744:330-1028(+)